MKVNIYLKANLHSLILRFTESVTEFSKRKIHLYVGILYAFFLGNLFRPRIIFF